MSVNETQTEFRLKGGSTTLASSHLGSITVRQNFENNWLDPPLTTIEQNPDTKLFIEQLNWEYEGLKLDELSSQAARTGTWWQTSWNRIKNYELTARYSNSYQSSEKTIKSIKLVDMGKPNGGNVYQPD
jgi:hypothetical protein